MNNKILCLSFITTLGLVSTAFAQQTEYKAHLTALNTSKTGTAAVGDASFKVRGDNLVIKISMKNTPPNIQHWEHFHGNPDGSPAKCVSSTQDANKDGLIDLIETETVSGTTMVPFNDAPHEMHIPTDTYPVADNKGRFSYTKVVPLKTLEKNFATKFNNGTLNLENRVLYVHGVPKTTQLPKTVQGAVGNYGTDVTLPIACGKIVRVK